MLEPVMGLSLKNITTSCMFIYMQVCKKVFIYNLIKF